MTWNARPPDGLRSDAFPLITPDVLYLGAQDKLLGWDAADGQQRMLIEEEDHELVPLAVEADYLLVRAIRTRGSQRSALWAVGKTGGQVRWTFDLGESPALDPPDANTGIIDEDVPVWTWHITSKGELAILRFRRAEDDVSHAIEVERLDLGTGASRGQQDVRLGIETTILSAPAFTIWRQDVLWMSIEGQLLGFDVAASNFVYRWP